MMTTEERINQLPACKECGAVQFVRYGHFAECSQFLSDANEQEQPMSDTLPERGDQKVEWHHFTLDKNSSIRQCAVCGFGESGHYKYFPLNAEQRPEVWLECCQGYSHAPWCSRYVSSDRCPQCGGLNTSRGKTRLWCNDCQRHTWTYGAYESDKEVSEHEPAARGGGDEWYVQVAGSNVYILDQNGNAIANLHNERIAREIVQQREQHQALVAALRQVPMLIEAAKGVINAHSHRGRKGYQQALTQGVNELSAALLPLIAIQETIYTALNDQKGPSE